jgi:hypothetical protein
MHWQRCQYTRWILDTKNRETISSVAFLSNLPRRTGEQNLSGGVSAFDRQKPEGVVCVLE